MERRGIWGMGLGFFGGVWGLGGLWGCCFNSIECMGFLGWVRVVLTLIL